MTSAITRTRRLLPALAAGATLVALAACSSTEPPSAVTPAASPSAPASSAPASSAPASASATSSPTQSPSDQESPQQGNDALLAAAGLAADEVAGSKVVSIEQERDGWEITVVSDDGDEQKLRTNADGTEVTSGPTDERPDADDRAENKQFAKVAVDVRKAASTIAKEVDGGTITELSLDADRAGIVWEADVTAGSEQRAVQIDADSGTVLSNRADD